MLRDELLLLQADLAPGMYPLYNVLPDDPVIIRTMGYLRQAVTLDGSRLSARWGLGRAALAAGEEQVAANALHPLVGNELRSPLLHLDTLWAASYSERPDEVVELYETVSLPLRGQVIGDMVALAYLDLAREQESTETLEKALALRPGDLYANYNLWQAARRTGDVGTANVYSETLTYFPLEAIHPADERLLDAAAQVIPALLEEGIWDRDKTLNVVSFLVWQHNKAAGVERLLGRLMDRYPDEPDWSFYLAELYHRRGDLEQAKAAYERVLQIDPNYAQTYLRLGMVSEVESQLDEAAGWYEQYREMAPDDLLGLKKLVEVYEALGRSEAMGLREEFEAKTDDRRIVAELLGVPVEDVELGPNLVENGGFEEWVDERPKWWGISNMATGDPWNKGCFFDSRDTLISWERIAGQVNGLWLQYRKDREPGRSGYWQIDENLHRLRPIALTTVLPYVLSFYYRTERVLDNAATVWVSYDSQVLFGGDHRLPSTNGSWFRFVVVGWNRSGGEAAVSPLLRSFAPGQVWFDEVKLYTINPPVLSYPQETRFSILMGN